MAKSLDGIKKLNPDDIRKYRKMILNYIGEKDSTGVQENSNQAAAPLRRVDSVNLSRLSRLTARGKGLFKQALVQGKTAGRPVNQAGDLDEKKAEAEKSREVERMRQAIKRQEEERKKIKQEERQYEIDKERAERESRERAERQRQEKIKLEKERIKQAEIRRKEIGRAKEIKDWEEKIRLEELEKEEKRRVEESSRLEKMKRAAEIKRVKQEIKIARLAAREKAKIKRQKAWRRIKKSFIFKVGECCAAFKKNIAYLISVLVIGSAVFYLVFCLAVLRFKVDSDITARLLKLAPLPAALTNQGVIGYLDYKKIENKNYLSLSLAEKKNYLAKWLILHNLKQKYGLAVGVTDDYLVMKYVLDEDLNQIPLARMNKINALLKGQGIELLGKYADEYNSGVYYDAVGATEKFGAEVLKLAVGRVSGVIIRADGYYLVERIADKNGQLGFKELFIKARTLDQYVAEKLIRIKVFILAN